jgi:cysteinyl-tRNA synthetase
MVKSVRKELAVAPEGQIDNEAAEQLKQLKERFGTAMNDDLNTSVALSVVFDLVRLANKLLQDGIATAQTLSAVDEQFGKLGGDVLGIVKDEYSEATGGDDELMDKLVNVLIDQRNQARKEKDFAKADGLRNRLDEMGIVLEDTPEKTAWRMK